MATHSPILMAYPDARILQLTADGIEAVAYEEAAHYLGTRNVLAVPERMLRVHLRHDELND
ncbi:hypothetical protein [Methyloversatilis discipulorum]|uniref:hypothetical protein n=1 Tax=Methyloversatilis discipulorum TaxID=1119528 RepID=UPI001A4FC8AD|nr:hypothetical protein [Methyloversatilis discipulorum]MBL8467064.1 hypothetical protein [Methyloversatilis discipulorum]